MCETSQLCVHKSFKMARGKEKPKKKKKNRDSSEERAKEKELRKQRRDEKFVADMADLRQKQAEAESMRREDAQRSSGGSGERRGFMYVDTFLCS